MIKFTDFKVENVTDGDRFAMITTTLSITNVSYVNFTDLNTNETFLTNSSEVDTNLLEEVSSYLWRVVPLPLFLVGIVGNILNIIVLKRMRFWQKSTLFFLAVLAFVDMTVLCVGLSRYWIKYVFEIDLRTFSDWGCKINFFVIYISMQYSSWILVCVTLERFIKTHFPLRYTTIVSVRRSGIVLVIIFIILTGVNGHIFFTNGLINGTECGATTQEYDDFEEYVFTYMDLSFLSVIPFLSMLIMNTGIYRKLRASHEWRKNSGFDARGVESMRKFSVKLTKMLLFTSTYFLIATIPVSIYFVIDSYYKPTDPVLVARMDIAWTTTYLFQFTNYTINFYLYTAVNIRYRQQLKELFGCKTNGMLSRKSAAYSLQENSSSRRQQNLQSSNQSDNIRNGIGISVISGISFVSEESVEV